MKEPIKGHGINFLQNRSEKILVNESNKNDVINVLGNPHTTSIDDENLWFYFDRKIASGKFNFTKLICTPAMMGKIGKHGKVLGPKGLMPNPKLGTVSDDVATAVKNAKSGQAEIRNDKDCLLYTSPSPRD